MKTNTFNRRNFIGHCTACAAGLTMLPWFTESLFGTSFSYSLPGKMSRPDVKPVIKAVFAYPDPSGPIWPNIGYDFDTKVAELKGNLLRECPGFEFRFMTTMNGSADEARRIVEEDPEVDGYAFFLVGCLWGNLSETLAAASKPMVMIDHLYAGSGEFLTAYAWAKRNNLPVLAVSSSDFQDVVHALDYLKVLKMIKHSNILVVGGEPDLVLNETYGLGVKGIPFDEVNQFYHAIPDKESKAMANDWITRSGIVKEPAFSDIQSAAGIYLTMTQLLETHKAQAITINCLGGIYSKQMVCAYPCLGFMELDNQGFVGACEADQRSTFTKLLMSYLVNRPGYISDPVIDTSKNQIIYAHCVAPTKVFGPNSPENAFQLRSHSEDRLGACNRSLMPLNEMTTTMQWDHHKKQVIYHQGISVENVDDDKACRNKLAVEVKGDVFKLLNEWDQWGWHRVTFYGDYKRELYDMAQLYGFSVIHEA